MTNYFYNQESQISLEPLAFFDLGRYKPELINGPVE
jgi:hypothetical protein